MDCHIQFGVFRENGPRWHLEITATQLSLGEVLGAQVPGAGPSESHALCESRDRTVSEEFREIHSNTGDQTPNPTTKCLGLNQFVVRGLRCVQFFRRAINRVKVAVGDMRVTKGWMFPRLCKTRGSHTWLQL